MYIFSIYDLIPYLVLTSFLILINRESLNFKNKALLSFIALLCFSMCRYGIGYDYTAYKTLIVENRNYYEYDRLEYLSLLLIYASKLCSYEFFFIVSSFITLYPIYFVSKRSSVRPELSLLIYYLNPFLFLDSLSVVRNAMAYSMFFIAFYLFTEKKIFFYFIFALISSQFHYSGYISFILPLFLKLTDKRNLHLLLFILSFFVGDIIVNAFGSFEGVFFIDKIGGYANLGKDVGSQKYLMILLAVINFYFWNKLPKTYFYMQLKKAVNLGYCIYFVFIFDDTLSYRIANYFLLLTILIFPSYIEIVAKRYRKLCFQCIILFFLTLFSIMFFLMINSYINDPVRMNALPYQTIFYHKDYTNYE